MACSPQEQWDELGWMGTVGWGAGMSDVQGELSTGPQLRHLWVLAREEGHVWVRTEWTPALLSQAAECHQCHQSPWESTGVLSVCDKSAWLMEGVSLPPGKLKCCSGLCSGPQVLQKDWGDIFISVAPEMALLSQPLTALLLNTSLCTPFHHSAASAAFPKPRFPHCHSSPYVTATPFSPHFHPSLPAADIPC